MAAPWIKKSILVLIHTMILGLCLNTVSFAQQTPTSGSIDGNVVETIFTFDPDTCGINQQGLESCVYTQEYYFEWTKDNTYPSSGPSANGFWSGNVWRTSLTSGDTLLGGPATYSGSKLIVWSQGTKTHQQAIDFKNAVYNDQYKAFTEYTTADGDSVTIESNPSIGFVDMTEEYEDTDFQTRPENNLACAGDPVYLHSGQFFYKCNDLSIPGRKVDLNLSHTYFGGSSFHGQFGYGWFLSYYMRLHTLRNGDVIIVDGESRKTRYSLDTGNIYLPTPGRFETLEKNLDGTWTLTKAQGDQYQFDSDGKATSMNDRNNNQITFGYASGKQDHFGAHPFGQNPLSSILIGRDYRLTSITDTTGRIVTLQYDANGLLEKIIDGSREVVFGYDSATNDLLTVTKPVTTQFPSGVTKSFEYENHNIKKIKDAKNQYFVENFYDYYGKQIVEQMLGQGSMFFDYSVDDQVTETDRKNFVTTYDFSPDGNIIRKEEFTQGIHANDPVSFVTTYSYNTDQLKTSETFPRGNGVVYQYDSGASGGTQDNRAAGNLLKVIRVEDMTNVTDPLTYVATGTDLETTFTYENLYNQVNSITNPKGDTTTYTYDHELLPSDPNYATKYDTKGNVIYIDQPMVTTGIPRTEFTYNSFGQVTETIDPNGNVVAYDYFPTTGYLKDIFQDPTGINAHASFTYDANGNLDVVTDANNHQTDFDYDDLNWLVKETKEVPFNYVTEYFYDANGNIERIERQASDPPGTLQITSFAYDVLNNLKTVTDPLNRVTEYFYDANENLEKIKDADTAVMFDTQNVYDERDLLFTVEDAQAGMTTYDYDLNGNLAKITDAETNETNYLYDLFDRLDIKTYADSSQVNYDYDENSNLDLVTLPGIHGTINYVYDDLNRLTGKDFNEPANPNPTPEISYDYDLGGRLTDADSNASEIDFNYDALNRVDDVTQRINSVDYLIDYDYEDNGNLKQIIYPSTKLIERTYDNLDRLDLVKVGGTTLVDYDYDPLDRRDTKTFTGLSPQQQANYTFDIANQLSSIANSVLPSTNISTHAYPGHDAAGNRTQYDRTLQTNPTDTIVYDYNNIYELIEEKINTVVTHSFDYDLVANREAVDSISYTPNSLNQYINIGGDVPTYDDNGNMTFNGDVVNPKNYTYDELNRLITFDTTGTINDATYEYDAFNRRVSKTVGGTTTYFVYDGDSVIAEYDGTGSLNAEYVLGGSIDEVLMMTRNSNDYYYHYDGLGSVTEITNATGGVQESYEYDPYGNVSIFDSSHQSLVTSLLENPYYFTGRRYDDESGIYYYRARQYDPELGRFIQRDPAGNIDSENLYQYVFNSPINYIDPTGYSANILIGMAVGAISGGVNAHLNKTNIWSGVITGAAAGGIAGLTFGAGGTVLVGITAGSSGNISDQALNNHLNNKPITDINYVSAGLSGLAGGLGAGAGVYMLSTSATVTAFDAALGSGLVTTFWQTNFTLINSGLEGLFANYNNDVCQPKYGEQ